MSTANKQAIAIREAESLILDGLKQVNAKRRKYEKLNKIRVQKGITELKEKMKKEKEDAELNQKTKPELVTGIDYGEKNTSMSANVVEEVPLDLMGPQGQELVYQPSISLIDAPAITPTAEL